MNLIMADFNSFPSITDSEQFASNNLLHAICFRASSYLWISRIKITATHLPIVVSGCGITKRTAKIEVEFRISKCCFTFL